MPEQAIDEALSKELKKHKGSWVAIDRKKNSVVASGRSVEVVRDEAIRKGVADPGIYRVPAHPERLAFF